MSCNNNNNNSNTIIMTFIMNSFYASHEELCDGIDMNIIYGVPWRYIKVLLLHLPNNDK